MTTNDDLRAISTESDWFVTMTIPAPSNLDHAQNRFEVEWRNARRQLSDRWTHDEMARLDDVIAGLRHHDAAAVVVVHARGGATFVELLDEPVSATTVHEGPLPRWATVLESRQRVVPHVVVETDRAGADLTGFVGSVVLASETVDGETLHIHRGAPGGWSQRRFQQRAENIWENNARDVADAVATMARDVRAELVAIAGDVRADGCSARVAACVAGHGRAVSGHGVVGDRDGTEHHRDSVHEHWRHRWRRAARKGHPDLRYSPDAVADGGRTAHAWGQRAGACACVGMGG